MRNFDFESDVEALNEYKEENRVGEAMDMIDRIFSYADTNPKFNTEFVESIQEQIDKTDEVTERQFAALERIINKWGIE